MTTPKDPAISLSFGVEIHGVTVATFSGCEGLDARYEAFEWQEGGDNGTVARLPGRLSYGNVQLTRAVDAESGRIAAWFSNQQKKPIRQTAVICLYDATRTLVTSWTLEGAWPVRYSGPKLTTGPEGEATAVETLELAHQGFTQFPDK